MTIALAAAIVSMAGGWAGGRSVGRQTERPAERQSERQGERRAEPPGSSEAAAAFQGERGVTRPSRDSTLGFTLPSEVLEVLVQGGATVKKGQPLVRARDDELRLQRDLQKTVAESDLPVQKAAVAVDNAQVEFDAQEALAKKSLGTSRIEFDRAKATLASRKVDLAIAKYELMQQQIQLAFREEQLKRMVLMAPFDGRVDKVTAEVGEVKRDTDPVIRVVSIDPLWIDVKVPTTRTLISGLRVGDRAWVLLDAPGEPEVSQGTIIEVAAEADFGSGTRRVRVETPNPKLLPAGLAAWVRFAEPPAGFKVAGGSKP
ncbi:MAG: efflux RND transporter periplasmic adaptor subunit [Phycisphaerales bacterium]